MTSLFNIFYISNWSIVAGGWGAPSVLHVPPLRAVRLHDLATTSREMPAVHRAEVTFVVEPAEFTLRVSG